MSISSKSYISDKNSVLYAAARIIRAEIMAIDVDAIVSLIPSDLRDAKSAKQLPRSLFKFGSWLL